MAAETRHLSGEITAIRRADGESRTLAASLPRLVLEARRIAANVIHGLHGRRRAGAGESFWQYRRFVSGEPSQNVDWRRSARDDHLYVREQEWEAAHTVWLWPDRSPSMAFASRQSRDSKLERGLIVTFALAELLVAGGERVGIPGLMNPTSSSSVIDNEPEIGSVIIAGRAERWASDYVARVALHRDEIRSETNRLDWLFSTHTTSRSAAELLLFLHSGMMVSKGSARIATVKAGRSA